MFVILSERDHERTQLNTVTVALVSRSTTVDGQGRAAAPTILLLQRAPVQTEHYTDPFPLAWELIGGNVELLENPIDAAVRELVEETGIILFHMSLVGVSPFIQRGEPVSNWIYLACVEGEKPVRLSHEHVGFMWVPLSDAREMQLAYKHSNILAAIVDRNSFMQ